MKTTTDFEFNAEYDGRLVTVELSVMMSEADLSCKDSDWDSKNYLYIDGYSVFEDDEQIYIDIPEKELYSRLRDLLREQEIEVGIENEGGEF